MRILHLAAILSSPLTVLAVIRIMIEADRDDQIRVSHSGSDSARINGHEIRMFHLTQNVLLEAARRFFGGTPIEVYFHDLVRGQPRYSQWGYQDTTCSAAVSITRVNNDNRNTETVLRQELNNDHPTQSATFTISVFTEVAATVTSIWEGMSEINLGKTIEYRINLAGGSLLMSWASSMGNSSTETQTQVLGQQFEATVTVPPNTTRIIEILAIRRVVDMFIDYELDLSGVSLTWYGRIHQGRVYWGHQIRDMLGAGHVPARRFVRQNMKIKYYFDSVINMLDDANELLETKKIKITTRPKRKGEPKHASTVKCLMLEKHQLIDDQ